MVVRDKRGLYNESQLYFHEVGTFQAKKNYSGDPGCIIVRASAGTVKWAYMLNP